MAGGTLLGGQLQLELGQPVLGRQRQSDYESEHVERWQPGLLSRLISFLPFRRKFF